jgi:hypothetical protein
MSDEPAAPSPTPDPVEPPPERARVEPAPRRSFDLLPGLYLLGFVILAGTLVYLWRNPPQSPQVQQAAQGVQTLQAQVQELGERVAQLQNRPAPNLQPLEQRIAALENRPAPAPQRAAQPPDLQPLAQRIEALEQRSPADLGPLDRRLQALEQRPPVDLAPLTARIDQLAAQGRDTTARIDARLGQIEPRLGQIEQHIGAVESQARQTQAGLEQVRQRAELAAKLQSASAALAAGQKLPPIPGAPPALARFQTETPPTEAQLRQSFEKYAADAERAGQPQGAENQSFGARLWGRAQQVVTVRQGDQVVLGDPVVGPVTHARQQLDAGDLAGAVRALDGLPAPAAAAMKPWTDQAHALLDARQAIANMAAAS